LWVTLNTSIHTAMRVEIDGPSSVISTSYLPLISNAHWPP